MGEKKFAENGKMAKNELRWQWYRFVREIWWHDSDRIHSRVIEGIENGEKKILRVVWGLHFDFVRFFDVLRLIIKVWDDNF